MPDTVLEGTPRSSGTSWIGGQKDHCHTETAGADVAMSCRKQIVTEESVRDLSEDARPISGARIGTDAASMGEIDQAGERSLHNLVRRLSGDIDNQSNTARIMLE